jgi:hypothetical protein
MDEVMKGKGEGRYRAWANGKVAKEIQVMLLQGPENVLSQRGQGLLEGPYLARKTQGNIHLYQTSAKINAWTSGVTSRHTSHPIEKVRHIFAHTL